MSSEWESLKKAAARENDASERAELLRQAEAHKAAKERTEQTNNARADYAKLAQSFRENLLDHGLNQDIGARPFTFRPPRDAWFASWRERKLVLIQVPDAGFSMARAGESGPAYSYPKALLFGSEIPPTLSHLLAPTEILQLRFYKSLVRSSEPVVGLAEMLANVTNYGFNPETVVTSLKKALAKWSASNWPSLDLDPPPKGVMR
jgi:hypothetical protein